MIGKLNLLEDAFLGQDILDIPQPNVNREEAFSEQEEEGAGRSREKAFSEPHLSNKLVWPSPTSFSTSRYC
jgi:hypothetical protein